jgi:hypothetical protein
VNGIIFFSLCGGAVSWAGRLDHFTSDPPRMWVDCRGRGIPWPFFLFDSRGFFGDAEGARLHVVWDWDLVPPTSLDSRSGQLAELHNRGAFGCIIMSGMISFFSIGKKERGLGFRFLDCIALFLPSLRIRWISTNFGTWTTKVRFFLFSMLPSRTYGRRLRFGDFRACPLSVSWATPVFGFCFFSLGLRFLRIASQHRR